MLSLRLSIAAAALLAAGPSLAQTGAVASGNLRVQATVLDQCVVRAQPVNRASSPASPSPQTPLGVVCATAMTGPAPGEPVFGARLPSASRVVSDGDRVVFYF